MSRKTLLFSALGLGVLSLLISIALVVSRQPRRRRVAISPPKAAPRVASDIDIAALPPESWTARFMERSADRKWDELDEDLNTLATRFPQQYAAWNLGYLHARARLENDDPSGALEKIEPFLTPANPFRDLALFHRAAIAQEAKDSAAAATFREELILRYAGSPYRDEAVDDQISYLSSLDEPAALIAFSSRMYPSAPTSRRRELDSRTVEILAAKQRFGEAVPKGLLLLRTSVSDDAAERVARVLDQSTVLGRLTPEELLLLGESDRNHRHFERAVALLRMALPRLPARREEITFAIGRSLFGNENYREAQQVYLRGASEATDPRMKATFFFHASRCQQLTGDDAGGEKSMTAAIAVPGRFPATSAALTQRLRTRINQKRMSEASADLAQIRKLFPKDHAVVDASLALATGLVAAGKSPEALRELEAIPLSLLEKYDGPEIQYWKARALESIDPHNAFLLHLRVLRADVPTHFAYFSRERLRLPALQAMLGPELLQRDREVARLMSEKKFDAARVLQTDVVLVSSQAAPALQRLRQIYTNLPAYEKVLNLERGSYPAFPLPPGSSRTVQLLAMGLFDEASNAIPAVYPLTPMTSALRQSEALNLGSASRESIYAIEVLMKSVPADFVPQLLPETVRQLLYPRYFYDVITEDSAKYNADPQLVLSIMREESRFNPRAKSEAAARGLLQFIITTARKVGRDVGIVSLSADDLYDPRVIIQLGAKYIASLLEQFERNPYKTAAAYNGGPNQVRLWARLAPATGNDFFLSAINFDETKQYVRKVLNSYERYGETYGSRGPVGGIRAEP